MKQLFATALAVLLMTLSQDASAQVDAGVTLANGANQEVTVGGVCRKVTNSSGQSIKIMSQNTTMWNDYITKTMSGVTIEACGASLVCADGVDQKDVDKGDQCYDSAAERETLANCNTAEAGSLTNGSWVYSQPHRYAAVGVFTPNPKPGWCVKTFWNKVLCRYTYQQRRCNYSSAHPTPPSNCHTPVFTNNTCSTSPGAFCCPTNQQLLCEKLPCGTLSTGTGWDMTSGCSCIAQW